MMIGAEENRWLTKVIQRLCVLAVVLLGVQTIAAPPAAAAYLTWTFAVNASDIDGSTANAQAGACGGKGCPAPTSNGPASATDWGAIQIQNTDCIAGITCGTVNNGNGTWTTTLQLAVYSNVYDKNSATQIWGFGGLGFNLAAGFASGDTAGSTLTVTEHDSNTIQNSGITYGNNNQILPSLIASNPNKGDYNNDLTIAWPTGTSTAAAVLPGGSVAYFSIVYTGTNAASFSPLSFQANNGGTTFNYGGTTGSITVPTTPAPVGTPHADGYVQVSASVVRCTGAGGTCNGGANFDAANTAGVFVPEPASLAILGSGLAGLALLRRRRAA